MKPNKEICRKCYEKNNHPIMEQFDYWDDWSFFYCYGKASVNHKDHWSPIDEVPDVCKYQLEHTVLIECEI